MTHVAIVGIERLVQTDHAGIAFFLLRLVEDTQHTVQPVVDAAMKAGNLHNDAVVGQALHKRIGHALRHLMAFVVVGLVLHIEDRLRDIAHQMAQEIDRHHRNGIARGSKVLLEHIFLVAVLRTKILTEAERLRGKPRLLQLDQDEVDTTIGLAHLRAKVDAKHGDVPATDIGILVATHLHADHLLLEQGRENGTRHALVLHQILEDGVVNRIGYVNHLFSFPYLLN